MYNHIILSQWISNSLHNTSEWLKSNRLEWSQRSLQEAETGLTKRWTRESWRILIWLDDNKRLILLDWRHLLQAYYVLQKNIPIDMIAFETNDSYDIFLSLYPSWSVIS